MSGSLLRSAVWALAMTAAGCAGRYGGTSAPRPAPARRGIEAAALPYQIVDARTGKSIDEPAFWSRLATTRAVCVGEEHPNPHHHWLQLHVVRELIKRLPRGTHLALAMEMFQRPFQGVLDDYAARRIDDAQLRSRSGYEDRWGYDYGFYGPTIDAAVHAGAQLLAANAAKELTKKVSHHGLDSLTAEERAQIPELKLDDRSHRAWFDALMEDMGGSSAHSQAKASAAEEPDADHGGEKSASKAPDKAMPPQHGADGGSEMPSADRIYTVQVIWDETMADTSAKWLAANPGGHLILLAGNGHCHDSAIVGRLKRRGVADALSIRGVIDDGEGSVGEALARPMNDYVVVLQMPAGVERKPDDDAPGTGKQGKP
ncbi:MAG TPA: ChaN family lipoprotein [Kofleriaceae bacterium]|nr:ChaN family lipoprotein [Kofleriaceae bacterium]